jgi:UDP-glucose 4-epimerase
MTGKSLHILVTGGAGFIGSHIVDAYLQAGHRVTVVDNLSTGKEANLSPGARFVKADIGDPVLGRLFAGGRFDVVNHHAAQMDVRRSVADPAMDARTNVLGLLNLLELSRRNGVGKIIFAASGGTYYGECRLPARESDPPAPLSPYGVSKLAGEHYIRAYGALHGLRFTVLRYGNVYGPRQDPHGEAGVVAIFCRRLSSGASVSIFGDGRQQRDYVHVSDVVRANGLALRRGDGESLNVGTGRAVSVNELFKTLKAASGSGSAAKRCPSRPGELLRSVLNVARAKKVLGWTPRVSLEKGLRETFLYARGPVS